MNVRRIVPLCLAGLVLAATAALAAETNPCRQQGRSSQAGSPPGRPGSRWATHLIDDATGADLRLTRLPSGALRVEIDGHNLEVRKTLHANGDFDLALRSDNDRIAVVRRGSQVRVSRRDRAIDLGTEALGEDDLDQLQQMLAGSAAVRRFRAMKSMLAPTTKGTGLAIAVDVIDMMLAVLKGESPTLPSPATPPAMSAMVNMEDGGPTCYDTWQGEVVSAWGDYEGCINSFSWYNPYREVCAFVWVLRVESAWFRFVGCSSIPMKIE